MEAAVASKNPHSVAITSRPSDALEVPNACCNSPAIAPPGEAMKEPQHERHCAQGKGGPAQAVLEALHGIRNTRLLSLSRDPLFAYLARRNRSRVRN